MIYPPVFPPGKYALPAQQSGKLRFESVQRFACTGYRYWFLQISYKKLHFCSQASFIPMVDGQSNLHFCLSIMHFASVHD